MDCALILPDLVGYEFGTLDDARRDAVETHLMGCSECLRAYLRLRRHLATAPSDARPSEAMRLRLRAQVKATFQQQRVGRVQRWLRRPIPFYQGAVAAAALALVVGFAMDASKGRRAVGARAAAAAQEMAQVDTSRRVPETLTIY